MRSHWGPRPIHLRESFVRAQPPPPQAWPALAEDQFSPQGEGVDRPVGKPPMSRLVHRHGEAMGLYLLLVYVCCHVVDPGAQAPTLDAILDFANRGQRSRTTLASLSGLDPHRRSSKVKLQRALTALEAHGLVHLAAPGTHGRYDFARLLNESGDGTPYVRPGAEYGDPFKMQTPQRCITIWNEVFEEGWTLVLPPNQLAVLFYLYGLRYRYRGGRQGKLFFAVRSERIEYYGLSDEVYRAAEQLESRGLVRIEKSAFSRKAAEDGRLRPYRFEINDRALSGDFFNVDAPFDPLWRTPRSIAGDREADPF